MYSIKNENGKRFESVLGFDDFNNYYDFFNYKTDKEIYLELLPESKCPTCTTLLGKDLEKLDKKFLKEIGVFDWEVDSLISSGGFFVTSIYLIDNLNPEQKEIMDKSVYIELCLNIIKQLNCIKRYSEKQNNSFKTKIENSIRIKKILDNCKYELKNIDSLNITDEMILNKNKDNIYMKNTLRYVEYLMGNKKNKLDLSWGEDFFSTFNLMLRERKITNLVSSSNEIEIDNFGYVRFERKLPATDLKYIPYLKNCIAMGGFEGIKYGLCLKLLFLEGQDRLLKTPALI